MELIQFKILNTAVERILNSEMSDIGLTYTQATVIGYLKRNMEKEICQKDIEYNLGLTHPTVSSILSRMEEIGMIVTEPLPADRRYKRIRATEEAISHSEQIHEKIEKIRQRMFEGISEEEERKLNETMKKIIRNIS